MAHDIMSQFYTCLNLPLSERLLEFTRIIDQSSPNKDLQVFFPQLIGNIFSNTFNNGWGLRTITFESNKYEFEALISFLEPQGPVFRLCYKLLSDPQLKYDLPLNILPVDLQITIERGRCPQFYADMLQTNSQTMNIVGLALNPFDYYIFNFALYLINYNQNPSWDNWNSVYFTLACDYLVHFLPTNPNVPVLPHIPHYTGKVPMIAPLQTANRPLYSSSLLLLSDLTGTSIQNQHSQTQSRNEVWRSETVLQVFIDIWMSVEQYNPRNIDMFQRNSSTSSVRVRTVRVLVKHLHSFSAKYCTDPAVRSSALRKYARQIMCARAYHYIKHLVMTWPLDASFRLVMELWLSLIQPWRYVDNNINQDRYPKSNDQEEANSYTLDSSYAQFIAENFPSYTHIFQLVLPRFTRLDLTTYKNAIMLFRLGKVFSQQHLVPILKNLEKAITDSGPSLNHSMDTTHNNSVHDQSYTYNGLNLNKWVSIAKQAISERNLSTDIEYQPLWTESTKQFASEFVTRILTAKMTAEKNVEEFTKKINTQNQGFWASIKHWLMIGTSVEDEQFLEECKKIPIFLNMSISYFSNIFDLNETTLHPPEQYTEENSSENSSYMNSSSFPASITNKFRSKSSEVHFMGDPDLMPITSYENTIAVRMLYQLATRLNEMYEEQFTRLWNRYDFWGFVFREILQAPCTIQTYVKNTNQQNVVKRNLLPRISLRKLGSHAFIIWLTIGYIVFCLCFSFSGFFYVFLLVTTWAAFILIKASLKMLKALNQ